MLAKIMSRCVVVAILGALVALLIGCDGISIKWPTPTPTPTATPEPTPTPEPTAFPTPSPAETPTPFPTPEQCILPPSQAPQSGCTDRPASLQFEDDVREAQRLAAANGFVVDGIVIDEVAYTREVARILRVMGLCAESGADVAGPIDEVWVKDTNGFSAHWDLVRGGTNGVLTLNAARCIPAKFD